MDKISKISCKILPIYWAFLTYLLLKPGSEDAEHFFLFPHFDKVGHAGVFFGLGFLLIAAFPKLKFITYIQIMLCFAFLTEILQDEMHLGRAMEGLDVVADTVGALIGYLVYQFLFRKLQNLHNIKK
ncbi:VanZ family protein [Elizabethkingia anophelis]|uniref:VanZ family protein n=1 Tax=Elizabethkingia anophelis TaxID=1117645 RepID=UPI0004644D57|nr:VanZ family protein [Elizabethkingia anophelis]AKH95725.1 antibiotic resistance protein VanZ [Elizabethkingia anophelis FMS-007]MBE9395615.1 VanZ family protein [Elizabethkingia anophelis]MBE9408421.1 VanZ family protein [Elizabethkingia anophelis]MCT3663732.1 VanZ family protein [Elizabethkingia anophelis]MCT3906510.1 VanZ family protein [Elizabethkingia anophelis]